LVGSSSLDAADARLLTVYRIVLLFLSQKEQHARMTEEQVSLAEEAKRQMLDSMDSFDVHDGAFDGSAVPSAGRAKTAWEVDAGGSGSGSDVGVLAPQRRAAHPGGAPRAATEEETLVATSVLSDEGSGVEQEFRLDDDDNYVPLGPPEAAATAAVTTSFQSSRASAASETLTPTRSAMRIAGVSRHERGKAGGAASRSSGAPPGSVAAVVGTPGRERTVLVPMRMAADGTMSRI
jgi:hypothetical protein